MKLSLTDIFINILLISVVLFGFGLIYQIWWLKIPGFVVGTCMLVAFSWSFYYDYKWRREEKQRTLKKTGLM